MENSDVDKFIESLKTMNMTEKEKKLYKAEKLGAAFGELVVMTGAFLLLSTFVWAILHYVFVLSVTWVQVLGAMFLFNLFKNIFLKPLLGKS